MLSAFYPIIATFIVSLMSLIGIITISIKKDIIDRIVFLLVSFSIGSLLAGAFLHLLPESIESIGSNLALRYALIGFIAFFLIERILHWRHCHKGAGCDVHTFTYMNIIGDGIHNFLDGILIAASFSTSYEVGIATTIAVIAHEIPQEIGDFGVLIYGGFSKAKALLVNFITALTAILGVFAFSFISGMVSHIEAFFVPFAAGGFLYIAGSDLLPELHKQKEISKIFLSLLFILFGIITLLLLEKFLG